MRTTLGAEIDHPEAHVLDVLTEMGLPMELDAEAGGVRVRHDGIELRGVRVDCRPMPDMLPILATLGSFAQGTTVFENVEHVRLKESDRVVSMLQLNRMGGDVELDGDTLVINGVRRMTGAALSSYNDHRVEMALAVAASRAEGSSSLTYPNAHRISYPAFVDDMTAIGIPMEIAERSERRPAGDELQIESVAIDQAAEIPIPAVGSALGPRATDGDGDRRRPRGRDARVELERARRGRRSDRDAAAAPRRAARRGGRLPAAQLGRVRRPDGRHAAHRRGLLPAHADLRPPRAVSHALRRSKARVFVVPERFRGRDHAVRDPGAARRRGRPRRRARARGRRR